MFVMMVMEYVCTYFGVRNLTRKLEHGSNSTAATNDAKGLPTVATTQQHSGKTAAAHDKSADTCQLDSSSKDSQSIAVQPELYGVHGCRQLSASQNAAVKQKVTCLSMEAGCVFHSVVLGLALGGMTNEPSLVLTLLIVLSVHQAVEGFAMGSVIAATQSLSLLKKVGLAVLYALTIPVGVAAGMLASASYSAESSVALIVQGVANGVSGGLLIWIALFSLLGEEINRPDLLHRPLLAAGLFLSVLIGGVIMSVIGVWA
jgi:zinc transporter 1/2/3